MKKCNNKTLKKEKKNHVRKQLVSYQRFSVESFFTLLCLYSKYKIVTSCYSVACLLDMIFKKCWVKLPTLQTTVNVIVSMQGVELMLPKVPQLLTLAASVSKTDWRSAVQKKAVAL